MDKLLSCVTLALGLGEHSRVPFIGSFNSLAVQSVQLFVRRLLAECAYSANDVVKNFKLHRGCYFNRKLLQYREDNFRHDAKQRALVMQIIKVDLNMIAINHRSFSAMAHD